MKTLIALFALGGTLLVADAASANGYGSAIVQQNIVVRQRQRIQPFHSFRNRQKIVVKQQFVAPVYAQDVVAQPVVVQPVVVQQYAVPQQVIVHPYVQQFVAPQYVQPQLQLQGGCSLGIRGGFSMF